MEYPIKARILNQNDEINNSNYQNIRMFSVPRNLKWTKHIFSKLENFKSQKR